MASERYSFSLTTFSPSGKLMQIEYALGAVTSGYSSVGIKTDHGIIIATEKNHKSILYDVHSVHKIEVISDHMGMVYSGMAPDYRILVRHARKLAQEYLLRYREPMPTSQLVQRLATIMQEYTQTGGVRPFGVSLLVAGWERGRPYLFQCDPSGSYFAWKATSIGRNHANAKEILEKKYNRDMQLEDAIDTAILALKDNFGGRMTADDIEIAICTQGVFKRLSPSKVKDYL